jgi:NOL1/NOP2/sun family putative RNA methylase
MDRQDIQTFERYRAIIPDVEAFQNALHQPLPTFVRVNTLKIAVEPFQNSMAENGYVLERTPGIEVAFRLHGSATPGSTLEYFLGYYHVQGLTSMLPPRILNPQPEERVLDLCAAPGGKATYLAQLMQNQGIVVANDFRRSRLRILRSHIDRLGTTSLLISCYQGQEFPKRILFDKILLDPPCSAEGTYRSGYQRPLSENPNVVKRLSHLQRHLLRRALNLLRKDGTLVYSTCTYAPEENEAVIDEVLRNGQAEMLPISIPFSHSQGLPSWQGERFHSDMTKAVRIYPHQINSWGFFIAHLRKQS